MMRFGWELKGLGLAAALAIILAAIGGMVLYFSSLPETLTSPLSNSILVLSIFTGSGYVSYKRGNKGLMRGITFGMSFFVLMVLLSMIMAQPISTMGCLRDLGISVGTGLLGGILGVSLNS